MLTTNYKLLCSHHLKSWLVPVLISIGIFATFRPVLAQLGEQKDGLSDYLSENSMDTGIEVVDGFSRVFYEYGEEKFFVSSEGQNSKQVSTNGKYIVWVTQKNDLPGQIYLYDITGDAMIQITHSGNNANPRVSREGKVVWEGWVYGAGVEESSSPEPVEGWQIFLFNGTKVAQLTNGDLSVNPDIEGDNIVYARRDVSGTWRSVVYSISQNEAKEISTGIASKHPKVKNGKIFIADGVEEFPLTAEDLFVLDLEPLSAPSEVTVEDVAEELEATASAQVKIELTPTVFPSPEVPSASDEADLSDQSITPAPPVILE